VNHSEASAPTTAGPRGGWPAAFGFRALSAALVTATFATLAWADWTQLGGAKPAWWLLPLAAVLAVGGVHELGGLFAQRGIKLPMWLLRPASMGVVLSAVAATELSDLRFFGDSPAAALVEMGWPAVAIALAVIGLCAVEIAGYRPGGGSIERLAAGSFTVVYVGLPLAFIVSLRLLCAHDADPEDSHRGQHIHGMLPLLSLVAVVKAGDIAAYVVGSLVGRHRMAPILSPGKTWEGAAASLAGSLAAAWVALEMYRTNGQAGPWGGWPLYGALVGLAGMAGDLAESLVKRECGVKDSGRSLGGLGGVLDLIDSLLFAAPVAWLLWVAGGR
jgi:phosphatidate cytidylyltransferase